ncbi:MAG: GntR family transcriptional regulator [Synergistaceae bacterium]|nr:GntR family transcriptional regulator [Synergistaceae bacterium]
MKKNNDKIISTAEDRASKAIIKQIIDHKYLPGEKLLEADLAKDLGMSRTPIRSALKRLAAEGFLEIQSNRGCSIPFLTLEDMNDLFKFRAELEGVAAFEAAQVITDAQIEEMKKLLELEKSIYPQADALKYNEVNKMIHQSIITASQNDYLIRAAKVIFLRSELYIFYYDRFCREKKPKTEYLDTPELHHSIIEHEKILRAFIEKEPAVAKILAKRHVLSTVEELRKAFYIWGTKMFDS